MKNLMILLIQVVWTLLFWTMTLLSVLMESMAALPLEWKTGGLFNNVELGFEDLLSPNISKVFALSDNWAQGLNSSKCSSLLFPDQTKQCSIFSNSVQDKNSAMDFIVDSQSFSTVSSLPLSAVSSMLPLGVLNEVDTCDLDHTDDCQISIDDLITFSPDTSLPAYKTAGNLISSSDLPTSSVSTKFSNVIFYIPEFSTIDLSGISENPTVCSSIAEVFNSSSIVSSDNLTESSRSNLPSSVENLDTDHCDFKTSEDEIEIRLTDIYNCSDHNYALRSPPTAEPQTVRQKTKKAGSSSVLAKENCFETTQKSISDSCIMTKDINQTSGDFSSAFDFSNMDPINLKIIEEIFGGSGMLDGIVDSGNISDDLVTARDSTGGVKKKAKVSKRAQSTSNIQTFDDESIDDDEEGDEEEEEEGDIDEARRKYLERRKKNNFASRRSRQIRKMKYTEMEERAIMLEKENEELKVKIAKLELLTSQMKETLIKKLKGS